MTLKSTLLPILLFFSFAAFAGRTIVPVVSPTALCQGDSFNLTITTPDTFAPGNVFYIELSDSSGSFAHPVIIDSVSSQYSDTLNIATPAVSKNSSHYRMRVVSSNDSIAIDSTYLTIHNTPQVTFQLPRPSYCTYAYTVPLTGGTPAGGVYSGTDVVDNAFQAYVSGTGTFAIQYLYTDSIGCSAQANASINIISCPAPSVAVQVSPAGICAGSDISITIQTSDVIGSDNVFTVQLSDSTGSFANPTVIATDTSSSGNTITIPAPVEPAGTHYQVRVVASDPATISVPYNVTFRARVAPPAVVLNATSMISLCGKDSFKLMVDSLHGIQYNWTFDGSAITAKGYSVYAKDSGWYKVAFMDTTIAGCSSGADSVFVGVYANPAKPVVTPHGIVNSCGSNPVGLSITAVNGVTYQWTDHGQNITGATHTTYFADSTGIYLVKATSNGCTTNSDSVRVNILPNPSVSLSFVLDSFCINSAPIALSGGKPLGGFYSGSYISGTGTFNPAASGSGAFEIVYTYSDSIGCSGSDSAKIHVYNCTTSGINELNNAHSFDMYPNPAAGKVNITVLDAGNCKMRLFNLLGQELVSQEFTQQLNYPLQGLAAGVYMVQISDLADTWKAVKRLVIQ